MLHALDAIHPCGYGTCLGKSCFCCLSAWSWSYLAPCGVLPTRSLVVLVTLSPCTMMSCPDRLAKSQGRCLKPTHEAVTHAWHPPQTRAGGDYFGTSWVQPVHRRGPLSLSCSQPSTAISTAKSNISCLKKSTKVAGTCMCTASNWRSSSQLMYMQGCTSEECSHCRHRWH